MFLIHVFPPPPRWLLLLALVARFALLLHVLVHVVVLAVVAMVLLPVPLPVVVGFVALLFASSDFGVSPVAPFPL